MIKSKSNGLETLPWDAPGRTLHMEDKVPLVTFAGYFDQDQPIKQADYRISQNLSKSEHVEIL